MIILALFAIAGWGLLFGACVYLYRWGRFMLRWEDAVQIALDEMDEAVKRTDDLLSRPLTEDSPEVKYVLLSLQAAREGVLTAARELAMQIDEEEMTEDDS